MNNAYNHLEKHKIFDKNLNTFLVPLSVAQHACELAMSDLGLEQVQETIDSEIKKLSEVVSSLYTDIEGEL